jgi:hypothetical protein
MNSGQPKLPMSSQINRGDGEKQPLGYPSELEPVDGAQRVQRSKHVFPGLFKQKAVTLISVDPRVNSEPLAMVLAIKASRPSSLPLFGASAVVPTVILHGAHSGDERADIDDLWDAMLAAEDKESSENGGINRGEPAELRKQHQGDSEWDEWLFDTESGRERLLAQAPANAFIIIHDLRRWMSADATQESYAKLAEHLAEWCQLGYTILILETTTDEAAPNLRAALGESVESIRATWDEGAPHELGGGCIVTRKKKGYFDTGPRRFNFWYKVFRNEFECGLEMRPDADPLSTKEMAIAQRRMMVDSMLKDGIQQKEIAKRLGRDASTISRDVEAIKKKLDWE